MLTKLDKNETITFLASDSMSINIYVQHGHDQDGGHDDHKLDQILHNQSKILKGLEIVMALEQDIEAVLTKVDAATTKIGTNVQSIADSTQVVSDDLDKIIAQLKAQNVDPTVVAALQAKADALQTLSDATDNNASALTALANKANGATPANPVPVTPPPAPPVV